MTGVSACLFGQGVSLNWIRPRRVMAATLCLAALCLGRRFESEMLILSAPQCAAEGPHTLPAFALVVFPLLRSTLFCGSVSVCVADTDAYVGL